MSPDIKRMSTDTTEAEVQARVESLSDGWYLDAESAREQQRSHEEKAHYHADKAKTHREKAERFAHYAELADQGRPVVFKERA